jgi:hypothetical protein
LDGVRLGWLAGRGGQVGRGVVVRCCGGSASWLGRLGRGAVFGRKQPKEMRRRFGGSVKPRARDILAKHRVVNAAARRPFWFTQEF